MKYYTWILIFSAVILLSACDTPGILRYKNYQNAEARVRIYGHSDQVDTLKIPAKNSRSIYFGFGTKWTSKFTVDYLNKIDSIKVDFSESDSIIYKDESLQSFLRKRKINVLKNRLTLPIVREDLK